MLLTGTYQRVLDDKQRLALPRPVRDALGADTRIFYAAPGTDGSVSLYSEQAFQQLAQQCEELSPTAEESRAFCRLFYGQAHRIELDRQGRLRIPLELVRLADLGRELVLLGVRDHLELWNRSRWEQYWMHQQARYDQIAERAFAQRSGAAAVETKAPSQKKSVDTRAKSMRKPR